MPVLMGERMCFLCFSVLDFCVLAYFSLRFTSVKSNPLELCNLVTLLDFLFNWREDYEARR